jgi:hypothetical protein
MNIAGLTILLSEPRPNAWHDNANRLAASTRRHGVGVIHADVEYVETSLAGKEQGLLAIKRHRWRGRGGPRRCRAARGAEIRLQIPPPAAISRRDDPASATLLGDLTAVAIWSPPASPASSVRVSGSVRCSKQGSAP